MSTYGCYNRAPLKKELVLIGPTCCGKTREIQVIPFRNTTDCQYTLSELGQADLKCDGCTWRHDPIPV